MKYSDLRPTIQTGDTIACKRRHWFSILIRVVTAESTNHTAVCFVDAHKGVWIAEMREGEGFLWTPASQWVEQALDKGTVITWCRRPEILHPRKLAKAIVNARSTQPRYGKWTLVKVWWSQLRDRPLKARYWVCSTFAQHVHEEGGYDLYTRLADPGDIEQHSPERKQITA